MSSATIAPHTLLLTPEEAARALSVGRSKVGIERLIWLNAVPVTVTDLEAVLRDAWLGDRDH